MQLGFLPRLTVRHTSTMEEGQIYVPQVNTALGGMACGAVGAGIQDVGFNLASAYGIAVTGTFLCTAIAGHGGVPPAVPLVAHRCDDSVFGILLFLIDTVFFFAANTVKIVEGGWVPLALGLALTGA